MRKSELLVFSLLLLNFVSATTLAQTGPWVPFDLKGTISFILGNPNVPSDWLVLPNLVYYIIFPFIAIVSVLYGIFSEIRIFKSTNVKFILAFVMAGMSLPTGLMISTVYFLYTLGTWIAVIAFGFLFIFGTILWAIGRGSGLKRELFDLQSELGKLKEESHRLDVLYAHGKIPKDKYMKQKNELAAKYRDYERRMGTIGNLGEPES